MLLKAKSISHLAFEKHFALNDKGIFFLQEESFDFEAPLTICMQKMVDHERFSSIRFEPRHDKTNKMACAPSKHSDQRGHPPSLIRVFAVRSMDS